jgi:hypothetical protein
VVCLHAERIAIPGADDDVAGHVVDDEPRAALDGDGFVGLRLARAGTFLRRRAGGERRD